MESVYPKPYRDLGDPRDSAEDLGGGLEAASAQIGTGVGWQG